MILKDGIKMIQSCENGAGPFADPESLHSRSASERIHVPRSLLCTRARRASIRPGNSHGAPQWLRWTRARPRISERPLTWWSSDPVIQWSSDPVIQSQKRKRKAWKAWKEPVLGVLGWFYFFINRHKSFFFRKKAKNSSAIQQQSIRFDARPRSIAGWQRMR